ncbi:MAG TPA: hypothetical protein VK886_10555 [Vicinamibacterales bacterium]|nr:hypothetical protein [Vicinamibacterales bacterium]
MGLCCRKKTTLLWIAVLAAGAVLAAQTAADLRREASDLDYNLDHAEAEALLERALALAPQDGATHRAIASSTWQDLLFRRGAVTVDHYLGSVSRQRVHVEKPPPALDRRFRQHAERALSIARARVAREPRSADAWYDLGASLGLLASYTATIEGRLMAGFRAARSAFDAHERVLRRNPSRKDAGLTVGTYRYVVATLSWPKRWMAYIAGFGGDKDRGIRMIEEAAAYPGESRMEARFALILIYNRERRHADALRVMDELRAQFPRNRLLVLEYGATALRAGRAADAEAALSAGLRALEADRRPLAGGERAMWHYKRGAARVRLARLADAESDLRAALAASPPRWIRGRAIVELGKLADLRGDRARARTHYREAAALCDADHDPLCAEEAQRLQQRAYLQ